ncbi:MAG: hypothetical protein C5B51_03225 [Terriglobia bacterium]|nr:MAG: hypothetical protein C5B51_03225 [Terriglobia bacterium]
MTMKCSRFLLTACVALIGFSTKVATADEWNKEMVLTFSAPVQVPGKMLDPGKYVFRLADSPSNRNLVQIFSVDDNGRQNFVAMIETVPDYRLKTPDKPMVQFEERHLGDPEAIKSWFYPGDNYGWHFVYPKSERLESASITQPPPAAAEPVAPPAPPEEPVASEPPAETAQDIPVLVIEKETVISQVQLVSDPSDDNLPAADRVLPETAGHSAAFLLAGIVTIAGGLFALSLSRRNAQATR